MMSHPHFADLHLEELFEPLDRPKPVLARIDEDLIDIFAWAFSEVHAAFAEKSEHVIIEYLIKVAHHSFELSNWVAFFAIFGVLAATSDTLAESWSRVETTMRSFYFENKVRDFFQSFHGSSDGFSPKFVTELQNPLKKIEGEESAH
jgi:hypothetical protein